MNGIAFRRRMMKRRPLPVAVSWAHKATEDRPCGRPKAARSSGRPGRRCLSPVGSATALRHDAKRKRHGPSIAVSGAVSLSAPGLDRNHPSRDALPIELRSRRRGNRGWPKRFLWALPFASPPRAGHVAFRLQPEDRRRCQRRVEAKRPSCLRLGALDKSPGSPSPCAPQ